ncbi:hypothetical protein JCM17823_02810 [Halorubrum gandharaense]
MPLRDRQDWSEPPATERATADVRAQSRIVDGPDDLDDLVARLADDRVVMLGEASHGTSEFYRWRARITAELIRDHGFDFVAVEGDWPSCFAINRFVKGLPEAPETVEAAVDAFDRWPTWMWANWETVAFFEWLRLHNETRSPDERVGFFGLDVYGLFESMHEVVDYLSDVDPEAAEHARGAYRCFEPYGEDAQEYARETRMVPESCKEEVVDVLLAMQERRREAAEAAGDDADRHPDERFGAEQNALVARNAEAYYRNLASRTDSWNVRDEHMAETLDRLLDHHAEDGAGAERGDGMDQPKAVVWAHNTHVGDARATDMAERGRLNVGQLVREAYGRENTSAVGFGSHRGRVVAADAWGEVPGRKEVPHAKAGSYEDVFHRAGGEDRLLFTDEVDPETALAEPRGHRAIGVVYRPALESGNYVPTDLRERYDAYLHVEETTALHSLERHPSRERVPELYPFGL